MEVDGDAIPTGDFIDVKGTPFDFRTPEKIDFRWNETVGLCGGGKLISIPFNYSLIVGLGHVECQGYDHCWIYDHNESVSPGVTLWSDVSGIKFVIFFH